MKRRGFKHRALWGLALWAGLTAGAFAQDSGCLIEPSADLKLGVPADGVLDRVMVERGEVVRKGQLLGRLNIDLETAQSRTLATKLAFGERKLDRNMELKDQNLIAPQEIGRAHV